MEDVADWYYAREKKQQGPVTLEALRAMAGSGELTAADMVWKNGTPDWKPAGEVADLSETFASIHTSAPDAAAAAQENGNVKHTVAVSAQTAAAGAAVMAATTPEPGHAYSGPHMDVSWDEREGASESEMPIPSYFIQSVFTTIFSLCGVVGFPFGLIAIAFGARVWGKLKAGDLDSARTFSDRAKICCRLCFWSTALVLVFYGYLFYTGVLKPADLTQRIQVSIGQ